MPHPTRLTRAELARFLPDERAIRAFEQILKVLSGSDSLQIQTEYLQKRVKTNEVLLWLSM